MKLHLGTLRKLGFEPSVTQELKKSIDKSKDELQVDPQGYVPVSVLKAHAKTLGLPPMVLDRLDGALRTAGTEPIATQTNLAEWPKAKLGVSEARSLEAADGKLDPSALSAYRKHLDPLFERIGKEELIGAPISAAELQDILREHGAKLKTSPSYETGLTQSQIDKLTEIACTKSAPAHTERDLTVNLDSSFKALDEQNGVRVFQKNQWEGFSVKRTDYGEVSLHAFKSDRIVVALPKGHVAMFVDADGNERAAALNKKTETINGEKVDTVEISRTMVEPNDRRGRIWNPNFTIKVLDPSGKTVYDQAFAFDKVPSWTSEEITRAKFGYQPIDTDERGRFIANHAIPKGSKNATPLGRRPAFESSEGGCDRFVIQRDGQSFAVDDLLQLLRPPKGKPEAFSGGPGKKRYLLEDDARTARSLDDPGERSYAVKLKTSTNEHITFDASLSQTTQARLGLGGISVLGADGKPVITFDPFDPSQDLNRRA